MEQKNLNIQYHDNHSFNIDKQNQQNQNKKQYKSKNNSKNNQSFQQKQQQKIQYKYVLKKDNQEDLIQQQQQQQQQEKQQDIIIQDVKKQEDKKQQVQNLEVIKFSNKTRVVNVKKAHISKEGYQNFEEWVKDPNNVYIGRRNQYVQGTFQSKWHNPFKISQNKTRDDVVEEFKDFILQNENLLNQLEDLNGKSLGCWCYPERCHGNVLMELLQEKFN